jgi:two-component system cell cycle sensor histidine kinase/response regulator CckA
MSAPAVRVAASFPSWFPTWLAPDSEKSGSPLLTSHTILVVDDEPGVRQLTARMLRDQGYTVLEAGSAEDALNQLRTSGQVRLVLADVAMPGMDGIKLAEHVHELYPEQAVVLMSAYSGLIAKAGIRGLPYAVLPKPFTAPQLAQKISEALRQH